MYKTSSRYDILSVLFYRAKKPRMKFRHIPCPEHPQHDHNAYEIYHVKDVVQPMVRCPCNFKDKETMMHSVYAEIIAWYVKNGTDIVRRQNFCATAFFNYYVRLFSNSSQILMRPPTTHTNPFRETNILPSPMFEEIIKEASVKYLHMLTGVLNPIPGSLVDRCYRILSWHEIIYKKFSHAMDFDGNYVGETFNRCVFATNNMTMYKKIKLVEEYDTNTDYHGIKLAMIRPDMTEAYNMTVDMLGVRPYFGTQFLEYKPKEFFLNVFKYTTGGGISPMVSGSFEQDGVQYRAHNSGVKALMFEANSKAFHRWFIGKTRNVDYPYYDFEVIRQKREWKKLLASLAKELLKKLPNGMREFFIPSMFHGFVGHLILGFIKKYLYGKAAKVGFNFDHGGAYMFAKSVGYDDPSRCFCQGDIYKLDKNIQSTIIYLYMVMAYQFYNKKDCTPRLRKLIRTLFRHYSYHSVSKMVLHLGGYWRIETGKVYSGDLQTSAIDCFAMVFLFCMYLTNCKREFPHLASIIQQAILLMVIAIVVYGDDHIWWHPKLMGTHINIKGFELYLKKYFNMVLREGAVRPFLTEIDPVTCQIKVQGIVFLKRCFIKNIYNDPRYPPVLPFKPTNDVIVSLGLKEFDAERNSDVDPIDLLLSCTGQAYDAKNNKVAYDVIAEIRDQVIAYYGVPNLVSKLDEFMQDPAHRLKINKILRRLNITEIEILTSFPTWEMILERNVLDLTKCRYGQDRQPGEMDFTQYMEDDGFDFDM